MTHAVALLPERVAERPPSAAISGRKAYARAGDVEPITSDRSSRRVPLDKE
jgi:hypothetical protein